MNDWALITGASSGIGRELARVFAANGYNLALVARNKARLVQLADELRAQHKTEAKIIPQDLAQPNVAAEIFKATRGISVSILVNNAGFGVYGPFAKNDLRVQTDVMQVNMIAVVQLTHWFLQPMLSRNGGRILNVASTAAFQPGPMVNVYYASKAFVYSFTYALAEELRDTGITVTALCPGTTRTEFFARAKLPVTRAWPMMDAREVAEIGYRGLMRGKRVVIAGARNKIASFVAKRLPPRLSVAAVRKVHKR